MRKYKIEMSGEVKEFENPSGADEVAVLLGEGTEENKVDIDAIKERYEGLEIFDRMVQAFNRESGKTKFIHYAYTKATAIDKKEYRLVSNYSPDFPPSEPIIEFTFAHEDTSALAYVPIDNGNCTFMDLWDVALDNFLEEPNKYLPGSYWYDEDKETLCLSLRDKGGWDEEIMIDMDRFYGEIKRFITSIRMVEEVK